MMPIAHFWQFNLAWKLALVWKGLAPRNLLDTYDSERIPVIAEMLNLSTDLLRKTMSHTTENMVKQGIEESPWHRGLKLTQLLVNYRWSNIVLDERYGNEEKGTFSAYGDPALKDQPVRAGDRAPDAPELMVLGTQSMTRIFDLVDPTKHIVLVFCGHKSPADISEQLSTYPHDYLRHVVVHPAGCTPSSASSPSIALSLVDHGGYAYRSYSMPTECLTAVIIRPDAMIGAIAIKPDGVKKYFSSIFV